MMRLLPETLILKRCGQVTAPRTATFLVMSKVPAALSIHGPSTWAPPPLGLMWQAQM